MVPISRGQEFNVVSNLIVSRKNESIEKFLFSNNIKSIYSVLTKEITKYMYNFTGHYLTVF